jgi:hypothetical protein
MGAGLAARKWFIDLRYHFGLGMRHKIFTQAMNLNIGYGFK